MHAENSDQPPAASCDVCRGTGKILSHLGGSSQTFACPWCEGSGRRLGMEHDAQAWASSQRALTADG